MKGNEICLEARIISVADVVEVISSHKPYQPALGIDVASQAIERGSGQFYDQIVAEACTKTSVMSDPVSGSRLQTGIGSKSSLRRCYSVWLPSAPCGQLTHPGLSGDLLDCLVNNAGTTSIHAATAPGTGLELALPTA